MCRTYPSAPFFPSHAALSTPPQVTYLSDDGAPTAVVNHTCDTVYGRNIATDAIDSVTLCPPDVLRHLVFGATTAAAAVKSAAHVRRARVTYVA